MKVYELINFLMNLDSQTEIFCEDQLQGDFYPLRFVKVGKLDTNSGGYSGCLCEKGEEMLLLSYSDLDDLKNLE